MQAELDGLLAFVHTGPTEPGDEEDGPENNAAALSRSLTEVFANARAREEEEDDKGGRRRGIGGRGGRGEDKAQAKAQKPRKDKSQERRKYIRNSQGRRSCRS